MVKAPDSEMAPQETTMAAILRVAQGITPENAGVLKELLAMHRDMMADESAKSFKAAMARLQASLPQIAKSGTILGKDGKKRSGFAKIEDIDVVLRPLLKAEGFSFAWDSEPVQGGTKFVGTVSHCDGHAETKTLFMPHESVPGCSQAQSVGSTVSYARRYLLSMHLNLVTRDEDDDGTAAGAKPITRDQAEQLHAKLTELQASEASVARFLNFMASPSVDEIAAANFGRACSFLDDKIRLKAAGAK